MAEVVFTQNLRRHVDVERCTVNAQTVDQALAQVFEMYPRMRGYLLDDTGAVRNHIAILLNGHSIRDRQSLSDAISDDAEVFVMQALSGG